jgi:hypothetical protein
MHVILQVHVFLIINQIQQVPAVHVTKLDYRQAHTSKVKKRCLKVGDGDYFPKQH